MGFHVEEAVALEAGPQNQGPAASGAQNAGSRKMRKMVEWMTQKIVNGNPRCFFLIAICIPPFLIAISIPSSYQQK
jgi:hypothetical protein